MYVLRYDTYKVEVASRGGWPITKGGLVQRVGEKGEKEGVERGGGKRGERRFWVIGRECKIRDDVKSGEKRRAILKNRKREGGVVKGNVMLRVRK